jgi:predicted TIM-barrel fold metal-dependent hydrolase
MPRICDAHCHFFSAGFLAALARDMPDPPAHPAVDLPERLGWDAPGSDQALADRWAAALDTHGVARAALIASVHGDESSVGVAVARHPDRFVGFFFVNPLAPDAEARTAAAFERGLRAMCLFPAMHHYVLDDTRIAALVNVAATHQAAVFVHCGVLSIGARRRLGIPSRFDARNGDPLAVAALAARRPDVPFIIPHFGAGMLREALMALDLAPNVHLDTSSSNAWLKYHPGLTLRKVFEQAIRVGGTSRLLFGTDSSFFPRGWQQAVLDEQRAALEQIGLSEADQQAIFAGNFDRLFS